jgi:hypothetical protein
MGERAGVDGQGRAPGASPRGAGRGRVGSRRARSSDGSPGGIMGSEFSKRPSPTISEKMGKVGLSLLCKIVVHGHPPYKKVPHQHFLAPFTVACLFITQMGSVSMCRSDLGPSGPGSHGRGPLPCGPLPCGRGALRRDARDGSGDVGGGGPWKGDPPRPAPLGFPGRSCSAPAVGWAPFVRSRGGGHRGWRFGPCRGAGATPLGGRGGSPGGWGEGTRQLAGGRGRRHGGGGDGGIQSEEAASRRAGDGGRRQTRQDGPRWPVGWGAGGRSTGHGRIYVGISLCGRLGREGDIYLRMARVRVKFPDGGNHVL